ncbi:hypothetical protein [Vibrio phage vB_VpaS_CHI]|nr:hypothetical protein [Vibrio phage vB_VpaS_ALK]USL90088.1 hypothetical protein [Vibrio phage vB_VpaS_CHI]
MIRVYTTKCFTYTTQDPRIYHNKLSESIILRLRLRSVNVVTLYPHN